MENVEAGEYEAAVSREKEDDRRSHRELLGGGEEEVSVAALNVRTPPFLRKFSSEASKDFL